MENDDIKNKENKDGFGQPVDNIEPNAPEIEDSQDESMFKPVWVNIFDVVKVFLIALVIVVPIKMFIVHPFSVKGASMEPTYYNGEYLIVDEITYKFREPKRGEVVVLRNPNNEKEFYIKRIIGLPNETVNISNGQITITNDQNPNSFILNESYLDPELLTSGFVNKKLSESEYFVMGDNRSASLDSRAIGAIPKKNLVGKTLIRVLPINRLTLFPIPSY